MEYIRRKRYKLATKAVSLILLLLVLSPIAGQNQLSAAVSNKSPVNVSASEEAVQVLRLLYANSGRNMISGQHDYLESPEEWNEEIRRLTGRYAGIHGYEMGAIMKQSKYGVAKQRMAVVESAKEWSRSGGLVTMTFHQSVPGTCACWSKVQTPMSQQQFDKYVTPGTPQYDRLIS